MKHVTKIVMPPVILGGLSTFFGNVGLAFSPIPFVVKYFFCGIVVLVVVGMLNAMVLLPAMLMASTRRKASQGQNVKPVS